MRTRLLFAAPLAAALACLVAPAREAPKPAEKAKPAKKGVLLWIEGEDATRKDVSPHPWWYDKVQRDKLSGGNWLHHFSDKRPGTAEYDLNAPAAGDYHFWVHANPVAAKLSYRLDGGPWKPIPNLDKKARDLVNIAADSKPDLRFIAWVDLGKLTLTKGKHTLAFKFHSGAQNHGGLDAIVLSREPFTPQGVDKPGGKPANRFDDGKTWAFEPAKDPFKADALLDLRHLNEKVAGEKGHVRVSPDGAGFVLGDGTPVRFWAVGTGVYTRPDADLAHHARFLAKVGVNMVRMHGSFAPKGKGKKITDHDQEEVERAWRLVAAMKKEGIYTTISPYWPAGGHTGTAASWGIEGHGDGASLWALLFFRDDLQKGYKAWLKALLTPKNPHTGIPLAKDPALAIFQVQNEDSLFFWTLQGLQPAQAELLGKKFGRWLAKKYGGLDAAGKAWGGAGVKGDDFAAGNVGLLSTWHMTQPLSGAEAKRLRDQVHFLAELQRDFYKEIARYLREDLGCKALVNASNWVTADTERLGDVERWTYTATDLVAVNRYYGGGPHTGPTAGWRIEPGDFFQGQSVLTNPTALPVSLKQVVGHPTLVTESCWVYPLAYESEGPFLVAAYGGLTGVGPFYWFSADAPGHNTEPYFPYQTFPGGQKGISKFPLHPGTTTQFPAAALLYRMGYVRPSKPVVHEERPLADLWDRKKPILAEGRAFDPNRMTTFAEGAQGRGAVDPLAFLVGRVEVKYGGARGRTRVADLRKYIDPRAKAVTSITGELKWDYGRGVCTLDAPKAQGVTGFLAEAGREFRLSDAVVRSGNGYATVTLVALDDKPLRESRNVLVQVGTLMRPTGWTTAEATHREGGAVYRGEKVVHTGTMPWRVAATDVTVTLKNPHLRAAVRLDAGGYRSGEVDVKMGDGSIEVKLPADCLYVVLRR